MARRKRKKKTKEMVHVQAGVRKEVICILAIALAILMAFSVITDQTGLLGKVLGTFLLGLFGIGSYLIPFLVIVFAVRFLWKKQHPGKMVYEGVLWGLFALMIMTFFHLLYRLVNPQAGQELLSYFEWGSYQNGGLIGALAGNLLYRLLGPVGACILLMALGIVLFVLATGRSFFGGLEKAYSTVQTSYKKTSKKRKAPRKLEEDIPVQIHDEEKETLHNIGGIFDFSSQFEKEEVEETHGEVPSEEPFIKEEIPALDDIAIDGPLDGPAAAPAAQEEEETTPMEFHNMDMDYEFPPVELLGLPPNQSFTESKAEMLGSAKKLEETLKSFGVVAKVVQINKGPSVTRYELTPNQGVKVAKIVSLADDIALSLAAAGIRIEAPIPGKSAVGIEVPNKEQKSVYFREVLDDDAFKNIPSKLAFGLGKDIAGQAIVADIAKMPHLLIAGATGSGKSVCINTLICSLIYKASPEEVKLIMVDPKVVELSVYNGIPHLMIPVVTDPKKAASALHWAVQEMLKRYKLFAEKNVRDLKGYNQALKEAEEEGFLPQIVIIIDELADLMMAAPNEVEDSICRLAQMARAAGMHLIIATQRPSVDVITGLIKANIPSRLAFAVTSGTDSRTILDMVGAEKLLGKGDMLFHPVGMAKPQRIQGAFITDKEVEKIVQAIRPKEPVSYDEEVLEKITTGAAEATLDDKDELFDKAVELLLSRDKASTSMIQREFRIGYNRAARIMEDMQKMGIVGNDDGGKFKKILINSVQWEEMKNRKEQGAE